ncbi:MAG: efflux RND transporter periplasmic adaptor subunit [Pseudomonadota bacterium]
MKTIIGLLMLTATMALAACDDEDVAETAERVRAIKTYEVTEPAGADIRRYSGTLVASDTSALSFPQSGTVETVAVAQGERIAAGDVLATLDPTPFELDRNAAQAEVASAQATLTEKQGDFARQQTLFEKGWVAAAALEQAVSALDGAEAALELARARLGTAERTLRNATLTAPFDGQIASRDVEPFQDVSAGQALFQINASGALEVVVSVSDAVVSRLVLGSTVAVDVATDPSCGCTARLIEIGTASGTANVVPVRAALIDGAAALIPGMTAEVSVPLDGGGGDGGLLVPLSAIAPGDDAAPGYVFVFDPEARVVRRTSVRGGNSAVDNLVSIVEGVSAGDIVASAGVSFLRDGQAVKLIGE